MGNYWTFSWFRPARMMSVFSRSARKKLKCLSKVPKSLRLKKPTCHWETNRSRIAWCAQKNLSNHLPPGWRWILPGWMWIPPGWMWIPPGLRWIVTTPCSLQAAHDIRTVRVDLGELGVELEPWPSMSYAIIWLIYCDPPKCLLQDLVHELKIDFFQIASCWMVFWSL